MIGTALQDCSALQSGLEKTLRYDDGAAEACFGVVVGGVYALAGPVAGIVNDRFGRKRPTAAPGDTEVRISASTGARGHHEFPQTNHLVDAVSS
ncbi:MAG: hypothetical protein OXF74_05575 [Rhodobacteraceae bacterium]|nr:hypothetical protein [Paracoccaceae bacterium]